MRKKFMLLVAVTLIAAAVVGVPGIPGIGVGSASAASTFERVNFTSAVVTADYLNVRQGAGTKFPIICVLKRGQWVNVLGKVGDWYAVFEPNTNCVGAASAAYLKVPSTTTTPAPSKTTPKTPTTPTTPTTPKTPTPSTGGGTTIGDISADEQSLLDLVNKARADNGASPLSFDSGVMKTARLKAKDMVDNNYFDHYSPTYGSPFDMMKQFGISFKSAGENIAGDRTVADAFKLWMNSEGHRKNILNPSFNYTGIGIYPSPTYGKILVQQFIGR